MKSQAWWHRLVIPVLGRQRQDDPRGSLASQHTPAGEPQKYPSLVTVLGYDTQRFIGMSLLFFLERGSCYVADASLKFIILLSQSLEC